MENKFKLTDDELKDYFESGGENYKVIGFDTFRSSRVGCAVTSRGNLYIQNGGLITKYEDGSGRMSDIETRFALDQLDTYLNGEMTRLSILADSLNAYRKLGSI